VWRSPIPHELPATGLGARATGLRLLQPPIQVGQLRLSFLQQRRLVFEPAQRGNLLEHLIARPRRCYARRF